MKFKITMKEKLYDKMFYLMNHIDELNNGKEIACWLTGDWKEEDDVYHLILDEMHIPEQTVSGAEIDVSEAELVNLVKRIGIKKANRIKAHWHIHPFGKGNTNWSATDEEHISSWTDVKKGREVFCFLLSSTNQIKGRVEVNVVREFMGKKEQVRYSFDNITVEKENKNTKSYKTELEKDIKEFVTEKEYKYVQTKWAKGYSYLDDDKSEDPLFTIKKKKKKVNIKIDIDFLKYVQKGTTEGVVKAILLNKGNVKKYSTYIVEYEFKNEKLSGQTMADMFDTELTFLEELYLAKTQKPKVLDRDYSYTDYYNKGWY